MDLIAAGPLLLAAPFIGSFLGTLVLRLPEGRPVVLARSACPHCGTGLGWRDLVPLLSWLWLRGRCRHCGAPIPGFYPAMELAALGVALWAATEAPAAGGALAASCLLGWTLLALALVDRRHFLLPDVLTLPLIGAGLGVTAWLAPERLPAHLGGMAAGYLLFAGIGAAYRRLRGRDGLGLGDAKLLAAGGAWLGWQGLPGVVLAAALMGLAEALLLRRRRRTIEDGIAGESDGAGADTSSGAGPEGDAPIAFGTWLAAAIWLVWLYGPPLPG